MAGKSKPKPKTRGKRKKTHGLDPEKIAEALDYRTQGYTIPVIALEMKISTLQAEQLIEAGLEDDYVEPPHFSIRLELRRLAMAQQTIMQQVAAGDAEAIRLMLQIEEKMARTKMLLVPDLKELFGNVALLSRANLPAKKTGRPQHQPTVDSHAKVDALARIGTPVAMIAKILGIGGTTLRQYYAETIETARYRMIAIAGGTVTEAMHKGDASVALRVLERLGGPEWKPPVAPTHDPRKTDPAGADVKHEVRVIGGLPAGSTPENPGGELGEVPPEETN